MTTIRYSTDGKFFHSFDEVELVYLLFKGWFGWGGGGVGRWVEGWLGELLGWLGDGLTEAVLLSM